MPSLRQARRTKAHASARLHKAYAYSEHMHALHALEDEFEWWEDVRPDRPACAVCDGDGDDKWNDRLLACPECGGTGREG
jgi:hypothetical protein